ncbi:hypothetical protein BJF93_07770 [Xaviernesmea oryzae]|uniref:Uncharacterized protein n=1 Tax=Xaviernesmea oryzae TaxID=464029 RepID=A0A1Q9B1Y7_9HYPH|nr:hypothetical protein [Xaviernesmea oryzae]OLP62011.1 hypothetical protein BJF93_07770 [Xaviernesmea oryzae]SEK97186.1 hypothetical protein SAMN04487976_10537 [Xaviernesmea oryzae]
MARYTIDDAVTDLSAVLDRAPKGAVSGEWTASTMQAGHADMSGGYKDSSGAYLSDPHGALFDAIQQIMSRLADAGHDRFNRMQITWTAGSWPFRKSKVTVQTLFDAASVPRGADDPVFERAADCRRRIWEDAGAYIEGYAARSEAANAHRQTAWFGPHRRVLLVRDQHGLHLVTDGLSTPWAGIAEPENGVECELILPMDMFGEPQSLDVQTDAQTVDLWATTLIAVGDLVADGYRVARDVSVHGAILFCALPDGCLPYTRLILSLDGRVLSNLPFGNVPLLRATPIREAELDGLDLDGTWAADAAKTILQRRHTKA